MSNINRDLENNNIISKGKKKKPEKEKEDLKEKKKEKEKEIRISKRKGGETRLKW